MADKSFSEVKRNWKQIGKLYVSENVEEECNGVESLLGFYNPGKKVMVKRMKLSKDGKHNNVFTREIENLQMFVEHENILNWFTLDRDEQFSYLSEERWTFTLEKVISSFRKFFSQNQEPCPKPLEYYMSYNRIKQKEDVVPLMLKLMNDVAKGLDHMHRNMSYIHRDLKAENIVIVCGQTSMTAKISNFSTTYRIGSKPRPNHQLMSNESTGFQSLEQMENNRRRNIDGKANLETSNDDMYSFGCLLFYSITLGEHPFGGSHGELSDLIRNLIKTGSLKLDSISAHLLENLMLSLPRARPPATFVLSHPLFWTSHKKLSFFKEVSELMETSGSLGGYLKQECEYTRFENWSNLINVEITNYLMEAPTTSQHTRRLIRAIRNHFVHFVTLPRNIKAIYNDTLQGLEEYYHTKFPDLLMSVYNTVLIRKDEINTKFGGCMLEYYG